MEKCFISLLIILGLPAMGASALYALYLFIDGERITAGIWAVIAYLLWKIFAFAADKEEEVYSS